jgi:rod shape-determining protein MreD
MNRLLMLSALFVCALLQAIAPAWGVMGQAKPPLLLGVVLFYALTREDSLVLESAVLAGLLQDSLGPIPHGFSVLAMTSVALLVNQFRDRVFAEHWFTHVTLGVAASAWVSIILYILLVSTGLRSGVHFSFVLSKALGMSLLGMVLIPLTFACLEKLELHLGLQPRRDT